MKNPKIRVGFKLKANGFRTVKPTWNAEKYSQGSKTQKLHAITMLQDLDKLAPSDILDIGSGNGHLNHKIAETLQ